MDSRTALRRPESFASLYEAHSRSVHASAYRILGREAEAEDVTQEVFLRLWREPERFDPARGEIGGYLRMMARSRALDVWRREQSAARARERLRPAGGPDEVDASERPDDAAQRADDRAILRAALRRLPLSQRQALLLTYWGGLTADEVARCERIPFGTARSRVRLGLEKLRGSCAVALAGGREG